MAEPTFDLDADGEHVWWAHDCTSGAEREPGAPIPVTPEPQHMLPRGKEKCWTVLQREPLTMVPSILCSDCGCHGFITNGEWVSV